MKVWSAVLMVALTLCTNAFAGFDEGLAAYNKKDYATALRELRVSAVDGYAEAQNILGVMYDNGQGVAQNYVQAHQWFNLAAANGMSIAVKHRDVIAQKMTSQQIVEAQKLAREWKPAK